MKRTGEQKFYIKSDNIHLLSILDDNYYMELGVVSIQLIDKLINHQVLDLSSLIYYDILNEGIGKISDDENDVNYQLNYLLSLRQKRSSNKFFLTCGTIKYYDNLKNQKYAPVVLIPIEIDYKNGKVISAGMPMTNRLLLKRLSTIIKDTKEEQNRFIDNYTNVLLNNIGMIDKYMESLAGDVHCQFSPSNYLTVCNVEYYDFTLENNYFNVERSIYETPSKDIINEYFKEVKAILPTNMDQKYVILKTIHGDNFTVDGRLGSGKTYSILNIIADGIYKNKKILYVDQDLDNVWDLEKNLKFLGLDSHVYNLTKSLREIEVPKITLPSITDIELSEEEKEKIFQYENTIDERFYGFNFRYIMETLAVLKNTQHQFLDMDVERIIQRYEALDLCDNLKKVENHFKIIKNYDQNIWRNLNISHNNFTINEIKERAERIYDIHISLKNAVENYCNRYSLEVPSNINDLDKLIGHVLSFDSIKPLAIWKNVEIRKNALDALFEIQQLSDIHYNSIYYYENNIDHNYEIGDAKKIFKKLCDKHYRTLNDENIECLDKLLSKENLTDLVYKLEQNQNNMSKYQVELSKIFESPNFNKSISLQDYTFFDRLLEFLNNNIVLRNWFDMLISDFNNFKLLGQKVKQLYEETKQTHEDYLKYLLGNENLNYDEIEALMVNREFASSIKKFFNKTLIRQKRINISEVIQLVRDYHEKMSKIKSYILEANYHSSKKLEDIIKSFINFYDFAFSLEPQQLVNFYKIVPKSKRETRLNLTHISSTLKLFLESCDEADKFSEYLGNLNIKVSGSFGFEKCQSLGLINEYLKRVIDCKSSLIQTFKNNVDITTKDIIKLIEVDEQFIDNKDTLEFNDVRYHNLLGNNYHGFDTSITDMIQILEHFDDFDRRVQNSMKIEDLFEDNTLSKMIDEGINLRKLWSEWFTAFRAFSVCFKGGKNIIQANNFEDNVKLLSEFKETTYQIESILYINEVLKKCKLYQLNSLYEHIINANEFDELSNTFLYVLLSKIYDILKKEKPYIFDFSEYENLIDKYNQYEMNYCTKNILSLQTSEDKRAKAKLLNYKFDDYNKIVDTMSKYVNVFLSDLNIFNSDFDLQLFDLVIIDDGHLSSANKYNRINECKQCVIFGDKSSQSSIANTLMQRVNDSSIVSYHNRYIRMSSRFNNVWTNNNRYIYNYDTRINKQMVNSIEHFAIKVVEFFEKNNNHIINVVVGQDSSKRNIYEAVVKELGKNYSNNEVIEILCYNIRIIDATHEGARYVNDVMIYYNDFIKLEQNQKELIFKNFVVVSNNVYIFFVGTKIDEQNALIMKNINTSIGKIISHPKKLTGISVILYNKLKEQNLRVREGFGYFDIIIDEKNTVAIMIVGKTRDEEYSLLDEYNYYYREYQRNGWIVEVIFISDLIDNFQETFNELVGLATNER